MFTLNRVLEHKMSTFKITKKDLSLQALESLIDECSQNQKLQNDKEVQMIINTGKKKIELVKDFVPRIIPLTHCKLNHPKDVRILLITKDPSTIYREAIEKDDSVKDLIKEVITVKNLKRRFKGSKMVTLYHEFDLVVADYRVHHLLPKILGARFFSGTKKIPFVIKMSKQVKMRGEKLNEECDTKYIRAQLKSITKNAYYLPNQDNCLTIRIGNIDKQSEGDMLNNAIDIINFLTDPTKTPQGGIIKSGIASIFVKTEHSASLPLYEAKTTKNNQKRNYDEELKNFKL